ncbi:MAG: hypothetical protein C0172_03040 [Caldisphaera sp.]|nr:MAG: hypothetical protein C0172_03040 [Caldisphaera sp.]HEM55610.1 hypothetical protein [Thermodesulfobium narugense]
MAEHDLYPDIKVWLEKYLRDKYKGYQIETTFETHKRALDMVLRERNIRLEEAIDLSIKIDILGILKRKEAIRLVFIEVKDKPLTLKDLGQLWGYTQLINPLESFLLSSSGLGSLSHILNVLKREDLLRYGRKMERFMKVAKWDIKRKCIDYSTLVPKL